MRAALPPPPRIADPSFSSPRIRARSELQQLGAAPAVKVSRQSHCHGLLKWLAVRL